MSITVTTSGPIGGGSAPTQPEIDRRTILGVIREVCPVIGLTVPTSVFSSTDREHVELQALANEMAERIAFDTHDWTKLKVVGLLTGDGTTYRFPLPEDYKRMLKSSNMWPSSMPNSPLKLYPDADDWLAMDVSALTWTTGAWTILGDDIYLKPTMPTGATASFYYLTDEIVIGEDSSLKTGFTADSDVFRLDRRILKLGMIWQWKATKGFPYSEDMATYEDALSVQVGNDRGPRVLASGQGRYPANVATAYPGSLG